MKTPKNAKFVGDHSKRFGNFPQSKSFDNTQESEKYTKQGSVKKMKTPKSIWLLDELKHDSDHGKFVYLAFPTEQKNTVEYTRKIVCAECKHYIHAEDDCAVIDGLIHISVWQPQMADEFSCPDGEPKEAEKNEER